MTRDSEMIFTPIQKPVFERMLCSTDDLSENHFNDAGKGKSRFRKNRTNTYKIKKTILNAAESPELLNALGSIAPYMDMGMQHNLYTMAGIIEVLTTIKRLGDGSFQKQHLTIPVSGSIRNSMRGFLRTLKHLNIDLSGQMVDNAILAYEISENLFSVLHDKDSSGGSIDKKIKTFERLVRTLKPVMPDKHFQQFDKVANIIKIAEVASMAEVLRKGSETNSEENPDIKQDNEEPEVQDQKDASVDMLLKFLQLISS